MSYFMKTQYDSKRFPLHSAISAKNYNLAVAGVNSGEKTLINLDPVAAPEALRKFINRQDTDGKTPLHVLADISAPDVKLIDVELASFLYSKGADISAQDHLGNTPLHVCAYNIKTEMAKIKNSSNIDKMVISMSNKLASFSPMLKFIIENGGDLSVTNNYGVSALQVITSGIPQSIKTIFDQDSIARIIHNTINGINTSIEASQHGHGVGHKKHQDNYHQEPSSVPAYVYGKHTQTVKPRSERSQEKCCILQ